MSDNMKIKVIYNNDIRRWHHDQTKLNLPSLHQFITSSFNLSQFWLQYEDDESDRLTLSTPTDFQDAFNCAIEQGRKSLKIYVIPGQIHPKPKPKHKLNPPPCQKSKSNDSNQNCFEMKQAAIEFLSDPEINKLLPDLHRRIFEEIKKAKTASKPNYDSPQSIEATIRHILTTDPKFLRIIQHDLFTKKLEPILPKISLKISAHLPFLLNFSSEAIGAWTPHLASVLNHGFNTFQSFQTCDMSSFFPLMCSFMSQHKDYDDNGEVIHSNVQCDECGVSPIKGARFKCLKCPNYDLCSQCESFNKHCQSHPMLKMNHNLRNMALGPYEGLVAMFPPPPVHPGHHHGHGHGHPGWFNGQQGHGWNRNNGRGRRGWCGNGNNGDRRAWKRWNRYQQNQNNQFQQQPWQMQYSANPNNPNSNQNNQNWEGQQQQQQQQIQKQQKRMKVMADFVSDVTLPDRTYYPIDTVLHKTWKMKNNGDYAWGDEVELVFFKGNESLSLEKRYPVVNALPGQEVEVSAVIKTPLKPGRYCSYYRLMRNEEYFGPRVWVDIFAVDKNEKKVKVKKNKNNCKKMKLEKVEAKLEAKQIKLEIKKEKLNNKIEDLNKALDQQAENEGSKKLVLKQAKLESKKMKLDQKVENLVSKKQRNLDEQKLLDDIVDAAVKDIEADMLKAISCVCGETLHKTDCNKGYDHGARVNCDVCNKLCVNEDVIYHCPKVNGARAHPNGYDLCQGCAEVQLQFEVLSPVQKIEDFEFEAELEQLRAMGFNDDEKIKKELKKRKGNVQRVANRLLQMQ